jgi:hypothetical protein
MQQRYCSCGCAIWVEYEFAQTNFRANPRIFFRLRKNFRTVFLSRCPSCKKALSIDDLA